jgi:hypothetical protein
METSHIPYPPNCCRRILTMADLLGRARGPKRASWTDLPERAGIYVVFCELAKSAIAFPAVCRRGYLCRGRKLRFSAKQVGLYS